LIAKVAKRSEDAVAKLSHAKDWLARDLKKERQQNEEVGSRLGYP
jgi:hypothetical protein